MKTKPDFYNNLANTIKTKYYPNVGYYRDNVSCTKGRYAIELFNNGCLSYANLIDRLSKHCKDTKENIHNIVKDFILDFEGYEYILK